MADQGFAMRGVRYVPSVQKARPLSCLYARGRVAKGDVLRAQAAGGGGYGDAKNRKVGLLAVDLADGKVTEVEARKAYPAALVEEALALGRTL